MKHKTNRMVYVETKNSVNILKIRCIPPCVCTENLSRTSHKAIFNVIPNKHIYNLCLSNAKLAATG